VAPAPRGPRPREDAASADQVVVAARIMLCHFFRGIANVRLDRPTATRPEVDEQRPSARTEQVGRMRLAPRPAGIGTITRWRRDESGHGARSVRPSRLGCLAPSHRQRIALSWISVSAHVQPVLLALAPEQHPAARRLDDERRRPCQIPSLLLVCTLAALPSGTLASAAASEPTLARQLVVPQLLRPGLTCTRTLTQQRVASGHRAGAVRVCGTSYGSGAGWRARSMRSTAFCGCQTTNKSVSPDNLVTRRRRRSEPSRQFLPRGATSAPDTSANGI
jgi:hypothetical protein